MSTDNPEISILTPSYNHEKYVKEFIESVLSQTFQDWELIIVDDCSSDNNVKEIQKFSDERIILIQHEYNKGINAGLNSAFEKARGKYIVFVASDDILELNHLEETTKYLDKHPEINLFYCSLSLIDEQGKQRTEREKHYILKYKDKYEVLKDLFLKRNILFSPGMVIRRKAFEKIYPLNLSVIQYQDYVMHIELLIENQACFSKKRLVKYRQASLPLNISAQSPAVLNRESLEEEKVMNSFLKIQDTKTLKKIFGSGLKEFGEPVNETIPYFLGRMAFKSFKSQKRKWGYRTIMNFIAEAKNSELLHTLYGFDFKRYLALAQNLGDISDELIADFDFKISKYKKLFNKFLVLAVIFGIIILGLLLGCFIQ